MSNKNFLGSVFVVAGCAMGAGCLAMPMLASGPNFVFSSIFLILSAILSYAIANVSLEIFLVYKNDTNLSTIVTQNFGKPGALICGLVNIVLMYVILSVYMTGGADLLDKTIFPLLNIHPASKISLIIFLAATLPIFLKGAEVVIRSNKLVFYIKLISLLVALTAGLFFMSPNLFRVETLQIRYIPKALPIFLAALWFHFLIPVIARINKYDRQECKKIFAVGLMLPVVLYICWVGIMLSLIPRYGSGHTFYTLLANNSSVGTMINYATYNNPYLPNIMKVSLNGFSNIAMLTSFLTVGLSNYDYIRDAFKIPQTKVGRLLNLTITMLPPSIFAFIFPEGFVFILQQASIMIMLINILMLSCCYKQYSSLTQKPGKFYIIILIIILCALIALQLLDNCDMLPSYGKN